MLQSPDADSTKAIRTEPAVSATSAQRPWRERVRHGLNGIGIVLLAVGTVSVVLALTGALPRPTAQPDSWADAISPISQAHENGLSFVMEVTPGPYFAGEMLLVKLSLTNYSVTTYQLQGASVEDLAQECGGALYAAINTGPGTQSFAPPTIGHCPFMGTSLVPGGTITLQEFLPLIFGGKVILEPDAQFLSSGTTSDGERTTGPGSDPLAGHWPSITLLVATTTPAARQITLRQAGSEVRISAPPLALQDLYYNYQLTCDLSQGGTEYSGNGGWEPISTTILHEPACSEAADFNPQWTYQVASPGFAVASGFGR